MADQVKYTNKLQDKRVLVLGGSSGMSHLVSEITDICSRSKGIGFCVAEALVEHGSTVIVSSSNEQRVKQTVERLTKAYPSAKSRVSGETCNLSDENVLESQIVSLLDKATNNSSQKLDHIVSTAADALAMTPLEQTDFQKVKQAGMTRFFAPLFIGKHAKKYLNEGPESSITYTTGAVSERPIPGWTVINSYATGLQGMVRGLALDLKPIRVNLVSPGGVDTELWTNSGFSEEAKKAALASMGKATATGKAAMPEQIAESYLYLMRDGNVDGHMVSTNGGSTLLGPSG